MENRERQHLRVGIVGPEERNLGNKALDAFSACGIILADAKSGILVKSVNGKSVAGFLPVPEKVILISGRSPVSVCDACGKRSFLPSDYPIDAIGFITYTQCEFCGEKKKRRSGGIDIYAEMCANTYGYETEIYPPEINKWADENGKIGFRSRNIKIAKASDILFVVVPKASTQCKHCGTKRPNHVSNGGCWTGVYAEERLRKRVIWILV
jgi:hypothetical protein